MRASQTVLPFKLTASDESLTAHAGLVLFDEYLGAMGIVGLINHELPGAGSAAGYDPSEPSETCISCWPPGAGRQAGPVQSDQPRQRCRCRRSRHCDGTMLLIRQSRIIADPNSSIRV